MEYLLLNYETLINRWQFIKFVKEEKACVPLHDGTGCVYEMKEGVGYNQAACCTKGISRVETVSASCNAALAAHVKENVCM